MASKTTSIPRFLLPQSGPMWRTAAARSAAFARPLDAGLVMVRYASSTEGAISNIASRRAYSAKSAASKAAKHAPPTKPPPSIKNAPKPAATKTLTGRTQTPSSASTSAPASASPVQPATTPVTPKLAASDAAAQAVAPKPKTTPTPAPAKPVVDPSKPIVLEKPERFNPPSHGARLPRSTPRHYGGPLTTEEVKAQAAKSYPGLPPPPNTWSYWFINSRGLHTFITLGTLTSLAVFTWVMNFKAKSPYIDMIPPISEFPRHPFQYIGVCIDVLRMTEEHESAQTAEKRRRRVEDVAKRNQYRKAHGLEPANQGIFGARAEVAEQTAETTGAASPATVIESSASTTEPSAAAAEVTEEGKRKKFWGIF